MTWLRSFALALFVGFFSGAAFAVAVELQAAT